MDKDMKHRKSIDKEMRHAFFMDAITNPNNWRPNFTAISQKTGISVSTCWDKYNKLRQKEKLQLHIEELSDIELREKTK